MAPIRLVATIFAATFAISGCGGSSENKVSNSEPHKTLTSAELISRADAICRRVNTFRHTTRITASGRT